MAATEGRKAGSATAAKGTPDKADGKGAAQTGTGAATDASSPSSGFGGSGIGADVLAVLLIGTLVSNILGARHWRQTMARASAQARERMEAERLYREAQRRAQEKNGYKGARQGEQQQRENPGDSYGTSENGEEAYETGDCADRTCPYEIAWTDYPDESGAHHTYAECANKGICDRTTGECECFDGYEGKGCGRMSCPNDCSGNGRCMYADELPYGVNVGSFYHSQDNSSDYLGELGQTNGNDAVTFDYHGWDEGKTRMCKCDPGYEGVDCSYRSCPEGNDVMVERLNRVAAVRYQKQAICLYHAGEGFSGNDYYNYDTANFHGNIKEAYAANFTGETFALTFTSAREERFTTIPINLDGRSTGTATTAAYIDAALEALPNGVIDSVSVAVELNSNGTQILGYTIEEFECDFLIVVTFDGIEVQGNQHLLEVEWRPCGDGCTPKVDGLPLATIGTQADNFDWSDSAHRSYVQQVQEADYESYVCGGRGKCDYSTGECECFTGYYGLHCQTQTALI